MTFLYIKLIVIFSLIGYLRFIMNKSSPKYLINLNTTNTSWLKKDSWRSRFTPIFSLFVVIYNYIAWSIYGLTSLLELVGYILSLIWTYVKFIILWIWHEVLHPTLFFVIKLCWHYLVIFSWKIFQFSFSFIIPSYCKSNILYSFKQLLIFSSTLSIIWIIYSLLNSKIILFIGCIGLAFLLQFLIFKSTSFFRSKNYKEEWIEPSLKLSALWFIIASTGSAVLFLLNQNSNDIVISGLSVPLTQILLPISIILFFVFIISFNFLPAYTSNADGKINIVDFVINIIYRLPKLIFSQPFYALGSAITLIIPLIISFLLLQSIESISKNNSIKWQRNIFQLPVVSLEISSNNDRVDGYKDALNEIDDKINNAIVYDEKLSLRKIAEAEKLKSLLIDNSIFTFEGDAFVEEMQRFSVNNILSCTEYKWAIIDPDTNKELIYDVVPSNNSLTYEFNHTWKYPGRYKIAFTPSNNCGTGQSISRIIYVKKRQEPKLLMDNPLGNEFVCQGDTAEYTAGTLGFDEYEWEIPNNARFLNAEKKVKTIKIIWGDNPGTVRVKGLIYSAEGHNAGRKIVNHSNWSGTLVNVAPSVGGTQFAVDKIPDEIIEIESIARPLLFYTLEEANEYIRVLKENLSTINFDNDKSNIISNLKLSKEEINSKIEMLNDDSAKNRSQISGTILAIFGFAILFSITFSTVWTYQISFNFDFYNFEQSNNHYWKNLIDDFKSQNPNQPLLGWFVLFIGGPVLLSSMIVIFSIF